MPIKDLISRKAYQKEYHKQWYKKNKEKRNAQILEYQKTKPKEWRLHIGRKCHLNKRYNLTPEQYKDKLISQNYCCAICGKNVENNIRGGEIIALSVDHCHKTGNLRDLLCLNCNSFLGHAKENVEFLQKAIDYLRKHMV